MIRLFSILTLLSLALANCGASSQEVENSKEVVCQTTIQLMESNKIDAVQSDTLTYQVIFDKYLDISIDYVIDSLELEIGHSDIHYEIQTLNNTNIIELSFETYKSCDCPTLLNASISYLIESVYKDQMNHNYKQIADIENEMDFTYMQMKKLEEELSSSSNAGGNSSQMQEVYEEALSNLSYLEKTYTKLLQTKTEISIQSAGILPCFKIVKAAK